MTSNALVIKPTGEVANAETINSYLTAILETVPDQGEGDVTGILSQIINSESVEDLDSPWQSAGMGKYNGYALEITSIKRMESDYEGGLGWYLLCEGTVMETGEFKAFSTSAVACMAQLLVAYTRGYFPYQVYVRIATKPTRKGYYPVHLETYRGGDLVDLGTEPAAGARQAPGQRGRLGAQRRPQPPHNPHAFNDANPGATAGTPAGES